MKRRANLAVQLAFGLCGLAGLACSGRADAQVAAAAPPAAPEYQDRYIGGGSLKPDISTGDNATSDTDGLARSLQIDAVASVLSSRGGGSTDNLTEDGVVVKSQWETATYGAWSLDAALRTGSSDQGPAEQGQGGVITLRQRGMPFDGDWQADNGLGDLNSPDINLARIQQRFYLPTAPMQGLTTEWRGPSELQIVAGGGVPGLYDGIVVPNFRTLDGSTATAGAEWSPASHWTVGGQLIEAHDVNLAIGPVIDGPALMSSTTGLMTAAFADQNQHLQFNLLDGDVNGKANGIGTWIDGSMVDGRFLQNAGVFRIDPNLTWGNQLISNDMQGGYYRLNYQSRQWLADVGVDEVHSVSGLGTNTTFLTGDSRYQLTRDWGIGGVANASRTDGGTSWSLEGYVDQVNDLGTGRAQADYADTTEGRDATLTLNENWTTPVGTRFSTAASVERISGALYNGLAQSSTILSLAAYGGGQFTTALGLEGNVRWAAAVQGQAAPGVSANVSLTWQLTPAWEILATYYDSRVGSWTPLVVESPLTPPLATPVPAAQERGIFLTLRYRRASGSHFAPLGGAPGAGSGEIAGLVFLDSNNNGQSDAGEVGAANVTVVLDGRFSMQTDANGRFVFPVVATGHHIITVVADNLPLPWVLVNGGRKEVEVTTRDRTEISIAAQRPR
ncbi:MAG TPA: SdrD B-like domain-containing protein [Steroidobacteraceae bacterium]